MSKKKSTLASVPKSIRQSVKSILNAAKNNDGITQAGVVYVTPEGLIGAGTIGSEGFNSLVDRVRVDFKTLRELAYDAFHAGQQSVAR